MLGKGKNETIVDYTSNLPNTFAKSNRTTSAKNDMFGGNAQLGYKRDFSKTSNLDLSASYNQWNRDGNSDFKQFSTYLNADSTTSSTNSFQRQISDVVNRTVEFKADYTNTFGEKHKIEAGYQGTFGWEHSPMETYSGLSQSTLLVTPSLWNTFLYNRMINAIYATYSGKIKNFNYLAGLRGEYSDIDTRSLAFGQASSDVEPHNTRYFDLFPSVFLSYQLPKDNQVQINYTRRISRPWGGQLNSFKNITDSTNISYGNPLLTPEYSNAFELNYIKTWNSHIFSFSGYYRTSDDVIQRISFMNNGLMNTTSDNIAKTTSAGTELVAKNRLFKVLNLTTTLNFYYYYLKGFEYMPSGATEAIVGNPQSNFTWNFRIIAQAMLPKGFTAQITGGYNAPQSIAQGTRQATYFIDAGVRKSIKDFTFNINARDILNSRSNSNTTLGKGFTQEAKNWRDGRTITFSVTYSFGNLKPDVKRRKENNNQDNIESENQMGAGYESE
jgi:outer membrane receptor protein involved in Fe transport